MKRLVAFIFCLLYLGTSGYADEPGLPSLVHSGQIGRLFYFRGPKPEVFFAPVAFWSSLTCTPRDNAPARTCALKITNSFLPDDKDQMDALLEENSRLSFSPIPPEQIEDIHEDLQNMDRDISTKSVHPPQTFALSSDPYISITFNKVQRTVDRILAAYQKDGLGTFTAEFSLDAERTEDYLEIGDTSSLVPVLEKSRSGVKAADLRPVLVRALQGGKIATGNLTEDEGVLVAYHFLLANFFRLTQEGSFYSRPERIEALPPSLLLVEETESPIHVHCKAVLPLKQDAQATIGCK